MKILCLGDSLTFGSVGYSYIQYLRPKIDAINAGINGETTVGAYRRLKNYLSQAHYSKIQTYVIAIGTNDLLLPYLSSLSPLWRIMMKPRMALKKCIVDDNVFEISYENILKILSEHHKEAVLIGIPFIQMKDFPLENIQKRNDIIKRLAGKYAVPFVDTYALQKRALKKSPQLYSWGSTNIPELSIRWSWLFFLSRRICSQRRAAWN
jgi:lysophospholipase L1-like esterase